jgi:hypothetical protein
MYWYKFNTNIKDQNESITLKLRNLLMKCIYKWSVHVYYTCRKSIETRDWFAQGGKLAKMKTRSLLSQYETIVTNIQTTNKTFLAFIPFPVVTISQPQKTWAN